MLQTSIGIDFRQSSFLPAQNHFEFSVMACRDVHIALLVNDSVTYQFIIGYNSNQMSAIRVTHRDTVTADTPGILHCEYMRKFWTKWSAEGKETTLEMGFGVVNTKRRLLHHKINGQGEYQYGVSVSTGSGAIGDFLFDEKQGT